MNTYRIPNDTVFYIFYTFVYILLSILGLFVVFNSKLWWHITYGILLSIMGSYCAYLCIIDYCKHRQEAKLEICKRILDD